LVVFAGRKKRTAVAVAPGPVWTSPFAAIGATPRPVALLAVAVGLGAFAALVDLPAVGAGVALVTLLALLLPRGPRLLAFGGIASLAAAAAFTVVKQWRNSYPPDFGWAGFFAPAHHLAYVGLLLMLASVAAGATRRRAARRGRRR
jgi:hypothetical protein